MRSGDFSGIGGALLTQESSSLTSFLGMRSPLSLNLGERVGVGEGGRLEKSKGRNGGGGLESGELRLPENAT